MVKIFRFLKERFVCLLGFHGFNCKEDVKAHRCSYCGCYFEGYLAAAEKADGAESQQLTGQGVNAGK